jgi:hypothetical protein
LCGRPRACLASRLSGGGTRRLHQSCRRSSKVEQSLGTRSGTVRFRAAAPGRRWRRCVAFAIAIAQRPPTMIAPADSRRRAKRVAEAEGRSLRARRPLRPEAQSRGVCSRRTAALPTQQARFDSGTPLRRRRGRLVRHVLAKHVHAGSIPAVCSNGALFRERHDLQNRGARFNSAARLRMLPPDSLRDTRRGAAGSSVF